MKENMCVCSFLDEKAFEEETFDYENMKIMFSETNSMPNSLKAYSLATVICDFENDDYVQKFLDIVEKYRIVHIHVFIIAEQWKIRNAVKGIPKLSDKISYTIIIKDDYCTTERIKGELYNFISPICSVGLHAYPSDYSGFSGQVNTQIFEDIQEADMRSLLYKIEETEYGIIGVFGSNYSLLEIHDMKKITDEKNIIWAFDPNKAFNCFVMIKGIRKASTTKNKNKSMAGGRGKDMTELEKELELKFNEMFGPISDED